MEADDLVNSRHRGEHDTVGPQDAMKGVFASVPSSACHTRGPSGRRCRARIARMHVTFPAK
jgi:hypothetical protein